MIEFSCQCGKQIKVSEKFAGRRAKCPGCGEPMTIPSPDVPEDEIDGDLLYEALGDTSGAPEEVSCPNCDRSMPVNVVVCSHCGYNRIVRSHVQLAQAANAPKPKREFGGPIMTLAGIELTWVRLIILLAVVIGLPTWYYTGPGAALHIKELQTVNVIWTVNSGKTRVPMTFGSNPGINMIKAINRDESKIPPLSESGEAEYTLGSSDALAVTTPDDEGDYILLRVSLRQLKIRDAGKTSLYDTIIKGEDFKLVPPDGSAPVEAQFLYHNFDAGKAEIDLYSADTSSFEALFPTEPTQIDVEREHGSIDGKAIWHKHNAKGEVEFHSSYSTGDFAAATGVRAEGRLELYNDRGATVDMYYKDDTLDVSWDDDAQGWWTKRRYEEPTHDWPWHRYEFALLFERPQSAGRYQLTYVGSTVATFRLDEMPGLKAPPVSPMKRVTSQQQANNPLKTSNNPLVYFEILADARNQAKGIVSANNLRQIGLGMSIYLEQNNQQWPERLDQLKDVIDGYDQLMVNPRTKAKPGFVYTKPEPGANPATTAVVHESAYGQPDPDGAVLYADGHIE